MTYDFGITANLSIKDSNRKEKINFRYKMRNNLKNPSLRGFSEYLSQNPKTPEYLIEDYVQYHFFPTSKTLTEEDTKKVKEAMLQILLQSIVLRSTETQELLKNINKFVMENKKYIKKEESKTLTNIVNSDVQNIDITTDTDQKLGTEQEPKNPKKQNHQNSR